VRRTSGDSASRPGYPANIGLLWHVGKTIALRPEISVTRTSSETSTDFPDIGVICPICDLPIDIGESEFTTWTWHLNLSGLFYLGDDGAAPSGGGLRTYLSPRVEFTRSSVSSEGSLVDAVGEGNSTYGVGGSFGAQYPLHRKLHVFGEVGLVYGWGSRSAASLEIHQTSLSTRTAVGVVLYLGN
jgi:hypothetical protein